MIWLPDKAEVMATPNNTVPVTMTLSTPKRWIIDPVTNAGENMTTMCH
jgi:hypothetical protein